MLTAVAAFGEFIAGVSATGGMPDENCDYWRTRGCPPFAQAFSNLGFFLVGEIEGGHAANASTELAQTSVLHVTAS